MSVSMQSNNPFLNHALPCSLTGALCAFSGIDGLEVLVNGPSACTGFASAFVDECHPLRERNSIRFSRLAIEGHPRVPCTEITDTDVILGIGDKLVEAVDLLAHKRPGECMALANSCSLSLIGEDAANILKDNACSDRILYLESIGCGRPFAQGYTDAMVRLIDQFASPRVSSRENTVNILGLPISQYSWKHDDREIRRLMKRAGLTVHTVLGSRSTLDEVRQLASAALNVVINPEYGLEVAGFMQDRFGLPYVALEHLPVGFDATRELMDKVLGFFQLPPAAALDEEERRCRTEAVLSLSHSQRTDLIRGLPVAIFGERAFVAGLARFLRDYLGCRPVVLGVQGVEGSPEETDALHLGFDAPSEILINPDADRALTAMNDHRPVITFGSAFEEYLLDQSDYAPRFFVPAARPAFCRTNLVHRPHIGFAGALTFIEAVLNCKLTHHYPYSGGQEDIHGA